jgi:hypothetical protein
MPLSADLGHVAVGDRLLHCGGKEKRVGAFSVGAVIMLGTLFGLIVLIFTLVLRFDPEARGPSKSRGDP